MKILVTGCAGFIGMHASLALCRDGHDVFGVDSLNSYYDVKLKCSRLQLLKSYKSFNFSRIDLSIRDQTIQYFDTVRPDYVLHFAAQAGVRHSVDFPYEYVSNNLVAFANVLEGCRSVRVSHLVFASSSSVYGSASQSPFKETDNCDTPNSFYAATKRSTELMAYSYSHLYKVPITGLRFFTVYGPWGRPDMAAFIFTRAIISGEPIEVFNQGNMIRDFTYVSDIIHGTLLIMGKPPASSVPFHIFNIGNENPVSLMYFIETLEKLLGKKSQKILLPLQSGDVQETSANMDAMFEYCNMSPKIDVEEGLKNFVCWYRSYYQV